MQSLKDKMTHNKQVKQIKLYVDDIGRKNKYLAIHSNGGIFPAVYFRKSKWITDDEYKKIVDFLLERAK